MKIRNLRVFLAVAEELHFRRAAERLGMAQPLVSRDVHDLEAELGVALFSRTNKWVKLTPAGAELMKDAAKILDLEEKAERNVRMIHAHAGERIRIGYVGSLMHSILPAILARISAEIPGLSIELRELFTGEQVRELLGKRLDLGFVRSWIRKPGLSFSPLVEESFVVILPEQWAVVERGEAFWKRLEERPFVSFAESCATELNDRVFSICARSGFVPRNLYAVDTYEAIVGLVGSGLCWSIVPAISPGVFRSLGRGIEAVELEEKASLGIARETAGGSHVSGRIVALAREVAADYLECAEPQNSSGLSSKK
jgi:DNA-binding transcriptional LysR family regulator